LVAAYERKGTYVAVAREFGCSESVVRKWVLRAKVTGDVQDAARAGRPPKGMLTVAATELLKQGIADEKGCPQLAADLKHQLGISVSSETVRRHLKLHLARPLRPVKKPQLSERHMRVRLSFAKRWARKAWGNAMITDSKYFWLCPRGIGRKVWVQYGKHAPMEATNKNCTKVHVYGGVSKWGRTPLFATVGTTCFKSETKGVTGRVYQKLLEESLIPACKRVMAGKYGSEWIFQQDNARAHTAKVTMAWLGMQDFMVMQWPARSPDLSWIESIWSWMAQALRKRNDLTTTNFHDVVVETWNNIPEEVYMAQFNSIKKRMKECIENNGGSTRF
jgi:transposase-like protein